MAVIEAKGLCKSYRNPVKEPGLAGAFRHLVNPVWKEVSAVTDVNLSIEPGETVAYVGPNGAGKSTTIKMLTGVLLPSAGEVRVNGLDPYRDRMANTRQIGVVFGQRTQLWWDIAVIESFTLIRDIYDIPARTYADNLAYLTEVLQLGPFLNLSARKLSLGQRMRADLALTLLYNPPVVFLDEPTIGLDVAVKERIREFLKQVNRDRGTTILLTSHDLDDIKDVCQRLVVIDRGTIIYDGTADDLTNRCVPHRRLIARLGSDPSSLVAHLETAPGIVLKEVKDREVTLDFDRFALSAKDVVTTLLAHGEVVDFQLEEPDIEDVVKSVYQGNLTL